MKKEFRLRFPPFFYEEIKLIVLLADKDKNTLYNVLKDTTTNANLVDITESLTKEINLDDNKIASILNFILSIFNIYIYSGQEINSFIKEIEIALEDIKEELELEKIQDWSKTIDFFQNVLSLENNIAIMAKSKGIGIEYPIVYHSSRILTDLRPVFPINLAQDFNAGIITHTLKIDYIKGGIRKEFYVKLDNSDFEDLIIQIDRAKEKVENIIRVANNKDIFLIGDDQ